MKAIYLTPYIPQVQVHIIEARDLKGEDLSGLSDPFVKVWCGVVEHGCCVY